MAVLLTGRSNAATKGIELEEVMVPTGRSMLDFSSLADVCEALPGAMPDRPFRTQAEVVEVGYEQDRCHFTLADGQARLPCVATRDALGFWVEAGQTLEVEGYADRSGEQPRLDVVVAEPAGVSRAFLHPANAEEVANVAREAGAEVLRGALRYPSETGGWQLGDLDLSEHLSKYRDCELVVIIAATGQAEEGPVVCGVCGFVLGEAGDCPRCKLIVEETARGIRARKEGRAAMLREVEEILGEDEDG